MTPNTPIQPSDINTDRHFSGMLNNFEKENAARCLICFVQERQDGWSPFTQEQLDELSYKWKAESFKRMLGDLIKDNEDGSYSFTIDFIAKCYGNSPSKGE